MNKPFMRHLLCIIELEVPSGFNERRPFPRGCLTKDIIC